MELSLGYRPAKQLSHVLRETSCNYFDDQLYVDAIEFLTSLLNSGTAHHLPCLVPFPQQLALLVTLVVHPSVTTRTESSESHQASNDALRLLHSVNKLAGPVNADFATAFQFSSFSRSSRGLKRRRVEVEPENSDEEDHGLKCSLANSGSLFSQKEDFWQILGWALNCSVVYPKRWERWQLLLEFMLDALEDDWALRIKLSQQKKLGNDQAAAERALLESVIAQYLPPADSRAARRKVTRAILADGSNKALSEFGEAFRNELKGPKTMVVEVSWKIDMEAAEYGDYDGDDNDDEHDVEAGFRGKRRARTERILGNNPMKRHENESSSQEDIDDDASALTQTGKPLQAGQSLGGIASVKIRARMLNLLYQVSLEMPERFTTVDDLFDIWTEFYRAMPLTAFTIMLNNILLPEQVQPFFFANLLLPLLNPLPPLYHPIHSEPPSQAALELNFLPFGANSSNISDHIKVSLVLESLMMNMIMNTKLTPSTKLAEAVQRGVQTREERATGDARKAGKGVLADEQSKNVLKRSHQRLLGLLELVEADAGLPRRLPGIELQSSPLTSSLPTSSGVHEDDLTIV